MNILISEAIADKNHGGAEKSMHSFATKMMAGKHSVHLHCDIHRDFACTSHTICHPASKLTPRRPIGFARWCVELRRAARQHGTDVILSHCTDRIMPTLLTSYFVGIPTLHYLKWVPANIEPPQSIKTVVGLCGNAHFLANSEYVANYWTKVIGQDIPVLINGIPERAEGPPPREEIRIPRLLFVGRIYEGKGLHALLQCCYQLTEVELRVVGEFADNDYKSKIGAMIADLHSGVRVDFCGQDDPTPHYHWADIVIVPSVWPESASRVAMEAMASGTLALLSDVGGQEILVPKTLQGHYMASPLPGALATSIRNYMKLPLSTRSAITKTARDHYSKHLTEKITHDRLRDKLSTIALAGQ